MCVNCNLPQINIILAANTAAESEKFSVNLSCVRKLSFPQSDFLQHWSGKQHKTLEDNSNGSEFF